MDARTNRAREAPPAAGGSIVVAGLRIVLFVLLTALFVPVVLLAAIGDRDGTRAYRVARWWAWLSIRSSGVTVTVEGLRHLEPRRSYVLMSNHRSALDILTLVVALWEIQLRWVTKAELRRIPGFGWCLRATRQIFVDRSDHASLAAARDRLSGGTSIVFFPEGTRSSGPLLPFKKGGFVFAIETGTPIVPIGILGAGSLLARGGPLRRWRSTVHVAVRPPVPTVGVDPDDLDVLLARVRWAIASAAHGRRPLPAAARPRSRSRAGVANVALPRR